MGRDKALVLVEGRPMAARVAEAARAAGATRVVAVGGQEGALEALDLPVVADPQPGGGPLQAVVGSLEALGPGIVLVLACDLVQPDPAAMAATVDALGGAPEAAVAVPLDDRGRRQWVHSAWRPTIAEPVLAEAWQRRERSLHRAVAGLVVLDVRGVERTGLLDADRPEDLPGDG